MFQNRGTFPILENLRECGEYHTLLASSKLKSNSQKTQNHSDKKGDLGFYVPHVTITLTDIMSLVTQLNSTLLIQFLHVIIFNHLGNRKTYQPIRIHNTGK